MQGTSSPIGYVGFQTVVFFGLFFDDYNSIGVSISQKSVKIFIFLKDIILLREGAREREHVQAGIHQPLLTFLLPGMLLQQPCSFEALSMSHPAAAEPAIPFVGCPEVSGPSPFC